MSFLDSLLLCYFIGLLPAYIAHKKGHSFWKWWLYGGLIFIIALPHAISLKPNEPSATDLPPNTRKQGPSAVTLIVLAVVSLIGLAVLESEKHQDRPSDNLDKGQASSVQPSESEAKEVPPTLAKEVPPTLAISIRPYDLVKNPFEYKGKVVTLELAANLGGQPIFDGSQFRGYLPPFNPKAGQLFGTLQPLAFDKMLSEQIGIYNVLGRSPGRLAFVLSNPPETVGQLAVIGAPEHAELDITRNWQIEPQGTAEGANALGASLSVPLVKFWRYSPEIQPSDHTTQSEEKCSPDVPAPCKSEQLSPGPQPQAQPQPPSQSSDVQDHPAQEPDQTDTIKQRLPGYEAQLHSIVVSCGFKPIGTPSLVDADAEGNKLLIQRAACSGVPNGYCQKLFIALNDRFLGTDTYLPSWGVYDVNQQSVGSFSAVYEDVSGDHSRQPVTVIYKWDGRQLTALGTPPTRPAHP